MTEPCFLFDSNCCIYLIEGLSEPLRERTEQYAPGEIVTSAVAYAEVAIGIDRTDPSSLRNFLRFFEIIPVLPFDRSVGDAYGSLPFARRRFDRLIAAHALVLGLTLVTNNERDFQDVAGLKIENWV
ncbi:MAG: type II toxin-antitoxin system VapC family toxin [Sphingomicrobium sp.]